MELTPQRTKCGETGRIKWGRNRRVRLKFVFSLSPWVFLSGLQGSARNSLNWFCTVSLRRDFSLLRAKGSGDFPLLPQQSSSAPTIKFKVDATLLVWLSCRLLKNRLPMLWSIWLFLSSATWPLPSPQRQEASDPFPTFSDECFVSFFNLWPTGHSQTEINHCVVT